MSLSVGAVAAPTESLAQVTAEPAECRVGDAVSGVVADMLSRRPLPGAVVLVQSPAEFVDQIGGRTIAGPDGVYQMCLEAFPQDLAAIALLDTVQSSPVPVAGPGMIDTLYVQWSQPVTIRGVVSSADGTPLEGARVTIQERRVRALTNDDGEFQLRGLGGGPLILTTTLVGFAPRSDTIVATSGGNLSVQITLGTEAIELEPIVVTARTPPSTRTRGTHELGMTKEEVEAVVHRTVDFVSLLRQANIAGLVIRPYGSDVCIEFMRQSGGCSMLQVYVNGIKVSNPSLMLSTIDPTLVEEFIVLRPAFAQFQYMGELTRNGVLDIILR